MKLQRKNQFSKILRSQNSTPELISSNVLYQGKIYRVTSATHSHLQLEGKTKAVPIWECERVI